MHQPAVGGLLLPVRRGLYYRGRQTRYRGVLFIGAGIVALTAYGFIATLQPDSHFGRILAAYGGIFVAGSLAWGARADGFRPDRGTTSSARRFACSGWQS
jgi:drug/metabolite transporter superfamily protein YnfA